VPNALDDAIATNIERHLRSTFEYTLDLTDAKHIMKGQDPLVAFLYDLKRGHCEYFAGAMTLLCQSLGMDARMVVGFKCDEYNDIGHYYTVRQSHAHAWVEVRTPTGWKTYDPTSSREAAQVATKSLCSGCATCSITSNSPTRNRSSPTTARAATTCSNRWKRR
jgi:transglutaminase-like putative cysteine protease